MEDSEKMLEIRAVTEADDDDSVLLFYLDQAKYAILNRMYPYITDDEEFDALEVPKCHEQKQIRIAVYLLNKRGAEGELQHIENGIHRNYKYSDVPDDLLRDVFPCVGIPR